MTKFISGPADKQSLMLKRAPRFLRVVQDNGGKFDTLDQLNDEPKPTEGIYVYEVVGKPGVCFMDFGGSSKHMSGAYAFATYQFVADQPEDKELRTTESWHEWCLSRAKRFPLITAH